MLGIDPGSVSKGQSWLGIVCPLRIELEPAACKCLPIVYLLDLKKNVLMRKM